ncbi:hypothetical protein FQN57_000678 [Myotisia sp. PD_48]|nr:hypothetical protein FQN57_000678 [Myotisia sp. PD_48]
MTSPESRKSLDSFTSTSTKSLNPQNFSFAQFDHNKPAPPRPRFGSRRSSTASNITGLGSSFQPTLQQHGSIAESGHNAISTLLQPPIVRTGLLIPHTSASSSGYKPPSTRDIPPVTLVNIPKVDPASFQPYLAQVGSLYDALRQAKEGEEQNASRIIRSSNLGLKSPELDQILNKTLERRVSSSSSLHSLASDTSIHTRRTSITQRPPPSATPLSTIPAVYFEENFHLENPRTFDIVSERSEVISSPTIGLATTDISADGTTEIRPNNRKALATNAILQEKLSWYLDTVEIHLISSISAASTSFFSALGSLKELHSEATTSVEKIQALRENLARLDDELARGGMKVINLQHRRENVRKLANAVCQLHQVVSTVTNCEQMIENGDLEDAIDELDDVERLMSGERPIKPRQNQPAMEKLIDLRGLEALDRAKEDFGQLRSRIGVGHEKRFLDILLEDLRRHVEESAPSTTLLRLGEAFQRSRRGHRNIKSTIPTYMNVDAEMRSKLRKELLGLGRARYTMPGAISFKNAVLREMKNIIRRHLPSSTDDDNESIMSASTYGGRQLNQQEKSSILARNLRCLGPDDAFTMLTKIYTGISEALRRLSVQVKVLLDITSGLETPSGVKSPSRSPSTPNIDTVASASLNLAVQDEILQVLDMSSLLGQTVDMAQAQIVKVLKIRTAQVEGLSPPQFLKYVSLNRIFAEECEAISGRSGEALKAIVDSHIKAYISSFGDTWKHRIVQAMDSDKWDAKDFGDKENVLLSHVLDASTRDADVWTATSKIWQDETNGAVLAPSPEASATNGTTKGRVKSAVIDDQNFILPDSALLILRVIEEFQHFMAGMPNAVPDIAPILLECLKLFHSRTYQLILGAGATKSAGLQHITTKHLALASQSLNFIIALIPYIREFIRRHCSSPPLMSEFDKVKRLFQEHQSGIHEKLVGIMSTRASVHVASMRKIDWETQNDPNAISPYMEVLAKETGTLHRVLSKHLPETSVMMIMTPVFDSYREQWTNAFQGVTLKSERARQRMLSDVQFLRSKLDKLDGGSELGNHLEGIIAAKPIAASPEAGSTNTASLDSAASPKNGEASDE